MKKIIGLFLLSCLIVYCGGKQKPPTPYVVGDNICETAKGETSANSPVDCAVPIPEPRPEPEPAEQLQSDAAKFLRFSFYHGLTTTKFDYAGYLKHVFQLGVNTRVMCDWPWNSQSAGNIMPYRWTGATYAFAGGLSPLFAGRIAEGGKLAKQYNRQILLVVATQGAKYGVNFYPKMGYEKIDYYQRADFPEYQTNGAWGRFQRYFGDVAAVTVPYAKNYGYYEPYNEHPGGSILDELKGITGAVKPKRGWKIQLNVANPVYLPADEAKALLAWMKRLLGGVSGVKASRLAFHSIYPDGVLRLKKLLLDAGISPSVVELSTDGATPWAGKFSTDHETGHYAARIHWDDNATNMAAVIKAHQDVIRLAQSNGFAMVDVQDTFKWSEDLQWSKKKYINFRMQCIKATE